MQARVQLMKTKAGRRFAGFLAAFNSGDPVKIRAFVAAYTTDEALAEHDTDQWHDELVRIHELTGGLRVLQVLAAEEYRVVVLLQAQDNATLVTAEMAVSEDYPHKIAAFITRTA